MSSFLPARIAAVLWWLYSVYLLLLKPAGAPSGIPYFDKVGHFVLFAIWALLLGLSRPSRGQPALRPTLLWCAAWAVLSEVAQGTLTATRSAEVGDVVADLCGSLCAILLLRWWIARRVGG